MRLANEDYPEPNTNAYIVTSRRVDIFLLYHNCRLLLVHHWHRGHYTGEIYGALERSKDGS